MKSFWKQKYQNQFKYGEVRSKCSEGHNHRSKLEASVCQIWQLRKKAGEFTEVKTEVSVIMKSPAGLKWRTVVDFLGEPGPVYGEAKGAESDRFKGTRFIWSLFGPGPLEIWKGTYQNPKLVETIIPNGIGE